MMTVLRLDFDYRLHRVMDISVYDVQNADVYGKDVVLSLNEIACLVNNRAQVSIEPAELDI